MRTLLQGDGWPKGGLKGGLLPTKKNANQRKPLTRISLLQSGRRDLTRPAASAAGAGLGPATGAKAPQAPQLNPRPPEPIDLKPEIYLARVGVLCLGKYATYAFQFHGSTGRIFGQFWPILIDINSLETK